MDVVIPEGFDLRGGRRSATVIIDVSSQFGRGVYLLRYEDGRHDTVDRARIITEAEDDD